MEPIDELANDTFLQALKCVEFRPLERGQLRASGYLCALALRYGLIGSAAIHYLLLSATCSEDERAVHQVAKMWPDVVEEHFQQCMRTKLPFSTGPAVAGTIGNLAYLPIGLELRLFPLFFPVEQILLAAAVQFALDFREDIQRGCSLFSRKKNQREFCTLGEKSVAFALNFFERRQAELEEVPEIALIGE